jgi:preprotein translocase subunit SecF
LAVPFEIIPPGTHIDFVGKSRLAISISIALLLAGVAAAVVKGVKFGIDFQGGTEMQVLFAGSVEADEGAVRNVVLACGVKGASVVRYGESVGHEFLIRFPAGEAASAGAKGCELDAEQKQAIERARLAGGGEADAGDKGETIDTLAYALRNAIGPLSVERVEFVGPNVGKELRADGAKSLLAASFIILLYIALRFSPRFAPGAVIALVHDISITSAVFVIFGLEFDLRVLAALLAILGYSINDTIVIYDRIREVMAIRTKFDLADVVNQSINQTLSRTVLTSGATMLSVLALWILGGEVIRPFAIAMAVGIVAGTYSTVYIAPPILLFLERRSRKAPAGAVEATAPGARELAARPDLDASRSSPSASRPSRKKSRR